MGDKAYCAFRSVFFLSSPFSTPLEIFSVTAISSSIFLLYREHWFVELSRARSDYGRSCMDVGGLAYLHAIRFLFG